MHRGSSHIELYHNRDNQVMNLIKSLSNKRCAIVRIAGNMHMQTVCKHVSNVHKICTNMHKTCIFSRCTLWMLWLLLVGCGNGDMLQRAVIGGDRTYGLGSHQTTLIIPPLPCLRRDTIRNLICKGVVGVVCRWAWM